MAKENGAFGSPKELANLLESIGLRLHAKNRIAGGESNYLWHLAEAIRATGKLAANFGQDADVEALFGDGYTAGTLTGAAQRERFLQLLAREKHRE